MTMACPQCKQKINPEWSMYQKWLKMMNFIEFLYQEKYIEVGTYEEMTDCMEHFKGVATESDYQELKKGIIEEYEADKLLEADR